ncbi:DUF4157 domain-containing protein [Streptomyces sp. NPDC053367]|uniref:eCIS core domain-containing protein n=1 Tax=Streptomyces sp. NPDC053367 TaxID=3365700 RepID=UPI0037D3AABD
MTEHVTKSPSLAVRSDTPQPTTERARPRQPGDLAPYEAHSVPLGLPATGHEFLRLSPSGVGNQGVGAFLRRERECRTSSRHPPGPVRHPPPGPGSPLTPSLRAGMEAHLGADLSQVRVHTSRSAAESARALHARAYTVGQHITFAAGEYRPSDAAGQRLLVHELAHTVQQSRGGSAPAGSERIEREAAASARRWSAGGGGAPVTEGSAVGVAREPDGTGDSGAEAQDSLGFLGDLAVDTVAGLMVGTGPQQQMLKAALIGFAAELGRQVSDREIREAIKAGLKELNTQEGRDQMAAAYWAGAVAGFVSPATDLLGLAVLAEHLRGFLQNLAVGALKGETQLQKDAELLYGDLCALRDSAFATLKQTLTKDPAQLFGVVKLYEHLERSAVREAGVAGRRGAHKVVRAFTAQESDVPPETVKDIVTTHTEAEKAGAASAVTGKMSRLQRATFHTRPARIGYDVGEAVGAVLSNVLVAVFTEGVGAAITEIAEGLGRVAPMLARAAEALAEIGRAVSAVERAIGLVIAKTLEKIKAIGTTLLKPFVELLGRLQHFLQDLKAVTARLETALAHGGAGTAVQKTVPAATTRTVEAAAPKAPKPPGPAADRGGNVVDLDQARARRAAKGKGTQPAKKPTRRGTAPAERRPHSETGSAAEPATSHGEAHPQSGTLPAARQAEIDVPLKATGTTGPVAGPPRAGGAPRGGVKTPSPRGTAGPQRSAVPSTTRAPKKPRSAAKPPERKGGPSADEGAIMKPVIDRVERVSPIRSDHDAAFFIDHELIRAKPARMSKVMQQEWDDYVRYARKRANDIGKAALAGDRLPAPPRTFANFREAYPRGHPLRNTIRGTEFDEKVTDVFLEEVDPGRITSVKAQHHISPARTGGRLTRPDVLFPDGEAWTVVSNKSRQEMARMKPPTARAQVRADLQEAYDRYTGAQYLRRTGDKVQINRVWLIYDGAHVPVHLRPAIKAEVAHYQLAHGLKGLVFRVGFLDSPHTP